MDSEADVFRMGGADTRNGRSHEGHEFKLLKVRTSKEATRSPRRSVDASNHSLLGGHGGPAGWLWRNSCTGGPPHAYPESPKLYNFFSGTGSSRCPSSPVHVPVTMAYTPAPGYVMFPVMLSGAPDSPRGGLTPLMGSPVSTPTAMMFPTTPFAQHPSAGPFAPPQGHGGPSMRPGSISGAPQVGGPGGHDGSSAYFHPLFNGFNGFGAPGVGMGPGPQCVFGGPGGPMVPMSQQCAKQQRNSGAGDKVRPYQPSPLKPGHRKSSGNGGPPAGVGAFPPMAPLVARTPNTSGGVGSSGSSASPQLSSTASSAGPRGGVKTQHGHSYQTPAHGSYQHPHGAAGGNGSGVHGGAGANEASSASPQQPAAPVSPDPTVPSYSSTSSAARPGTSTSANTTPRDALDPTTAAAAAAVVAAAAVAVSNMSTGPTPRTSFTGPSVVPPPRSSMTGGMLQRASGRTSSSGVAMPGAAAAALGAAVNVAGRVSMTDESSGPMPASVLDTDGVAISSGDVDIPPYGCYVSHGMQHHSNGAHAAAAAASASSWGFYDATSAAGMNSQQMWPGAMPRLYGAAPHVMGGNMGHMSHHHHVHNHHQAVSMAQQHASQQAMQQPSLLHAAMLQQLAVAAQGPMGSHGMQCYMTAPSLESDYMAAAAAEHLVQLQALQGSLIAQQNLRAAAAAVADMQHPVMAAAANAAALSSGGMLMNPALLSGALGGHHHPHHHHMAGGMHMHGMGMGALGPRQRRNHGSAVGSGAASASGGGADGQVRLNARQRRTLRRAKERAIRGLLEAGKMLVARTMGDGEDGVASGCDLPSGGYDSDDGDHSDDGESPARPACVSVSACSGSAISAGGSSPEVSLTACSAVSAAAPACPMAEVASPMPAPAVGGQQLLASHVGTTGVNHSPCSSNVSSVCEAGSSGGRAVSNASSVAGPETLLMGVANSTPSSGKASPLSAEGSNEPSPAPAPAAPPRASAVAAAQVSPAPSGRSTSAGGGPAGPVAVAAAALASGTASEVDITALIQQLNQKREGGVVDEKLLRDLEIINNLIGALKSSVPNAAPSYNAQGRKPSAGPSHTHAHAHHHSHANVNAAHAMHYLGGTPKLPKGFAMGY